jgi:hypothetical protein
MRRRNANSHIKAKDAAIWHKTNGRHRFCGGLFFNAGVAHSAALPAILSLAFVLGAGRTTFLNVSKAQIFT